MQVFDAIRTRLTVREFKPDAVPDEAVDRLLRAGQWAASSRNLQPWRFIVIRDRDTLARIGAAASSGRFIADAPLAIAIAMDSADRPDLDTGRAMQQMELAAWEMGLGTCFVGLRVAEQNRRVKEILGIPDSLELVTVLPFGYRRDGNDGARGIKNRKPLSEIAHSERFGQPYR